MTIEIPKYTDLSPDPGGERWSAVGSPAWLQPQRTDGEKLKPIIRCNCGHWCELGLHHVHADGTVTASFFHSKGTNYEIGESLEGCSWHVWIKLTGWTGGEFPPDRKAA
jgi:hypothetical protein